MLRQCHVLQHSTYLSSAALACSIAKDMPALHHHFHIVLPLLELIGAKRYAEIGSFAGASLCLAAHCSTLEHLCCIDPYKVLPNSAANIQSHVERHTRAGASGVGSGSSRHIGLTIEPRLFDDRLLLRSLYQQPAPNLDVLFIDQGENKEVLVRMFEYYHGLVRPGGIIIWNDFGNYKQSSDVRLAVAASLRQFSFIQWNVLGCLPNRSRALGPCQHNNNTLNLLFVVQRPLLSTLGLVGLSLAQPVIRFGIVMATYRRPYLDDPTVPLKRALSSILAQQHAHWKVFVVGDKYLNQAELTCATQCCGIDGERLTLANLPVACEREYESDQWKRWATGGTSAMNYALELIRLDNITHVAHLDDDDEWLPHHLAVCATAYEKNKKVAFVYTQAKSRDGVLLPAESDNKTEDLLPRARNLIHSAATWNTSLLPLRYMNGEDAVTYSDADMWTRMAAECVAKQLLTVYKSSVSVLYHGTV